MLRLNEDVITRRVTGDAQSLSTTSTAALKADRKARIEVKLFRDTVFLQLATGDSLALIVKDNGSYEGAVLQLVTLTEADWVPSLGAYRKTFSLRTTAVDALLGIDATVGNEVSPKRVMAALLYQKGAEEPEESHEFYIDLYPMIIQDGDVGPDGEIEGHEAWLSARAVRYDAAQALTDLQQIQAQQNIGMAYDAAKGGLVVTLADGVEGFLPVYAVPE